MFRDRTDAGRSLAARLQAYKDRPDVVVLALPRGGVPVGFEIARELHIPLDIFLVRKLGVPGQEELAFGAIASGGTQVLDHELIAAIGLRAQEMEQIVAREQRELNRREQAYREGRSRVDVQGRTVILVDDGLATGASMLAAIRALRAAHPAQIVVAVPVAAAATCERIRREANEIVCAETPEPFWSVGTWYADFNQTSDDEVRRLLAHAQPASAEAKSRPVVT